MSVDVTTALAVTLSFAPELLAIVAVLALLFLLGRRVGVPCGVTISKADSASRRAPRRSAVQRSRDPLDDLRLVQLWLLCPVCGADVPPGGRRGRRRTYYSESCKQAAYRRRGRGAPGGSAPTGAVRTAPNPGGTVSGGSHLVLTCLICEEKIPTRRGDIRVECRCGAEYRARTGQLVDEPICGLLHGGKALSAQRLRR
jgi:hypothetical protein